MRLMKMLIQCGFESQQRLAKCLQSHFINVKALYNQEIHLTACVDFAFLEKYLACYHRKGIWQFKIPLMKPSHKSVIR